MSVGKHREFLERRYSSLLAGFLTGYHMLKLFNDQVSPGTVCANA